MEQSPLNELFENHYSELKDRAARQLRRWDGRLHLDAGELVHLLYDRMATKERVAVEGEAGFLNLAEHQMKWVLTDLYRHRQRQSRGGGQDHVALEDHFKS